MSWVPVSLCFEARKAQLGQGFACACARCAEERRLGTGRRFRGGGEGVWGRWFFGVVLNSLPGYVFRTLNLLGKQTKWTLFGNSGSEQNRRPKDCVFSRGYPFQTLCKGAQKEAEIHGECPIWWGLGSANKWFFWIRKGQVPLIRDGSTSYQSGLVALKKVATGCKCPYRGSVGVVGLGGIAGKHVVDLGGSWGRYVWCC